MGPRAGDHGSTHSRTSAGGSAPRARVEIMINGSIPLAPGNGRGKANASSVAQRLDRWRDVLSRLTANPDLGHLPRRMRQRACQLLYRIGVYHLPTRPVYRGLDGPVTIQ